MFILAPTASVIILFLTVTRLTSPNVMSVLKEIIPIVHFDRFSLWTGKVWVHASLLALDIFHRSFTGLSACKWLCMHLSVVMLCWRPSPALLLLLTDFYASVFITLLGHSYGDSSSFCLYHCCSQHSALCRQYCSCANLRCHYTRLALSESSSILFGDQMIW